jgi:protein ImuB
VLEELGIKGVQELFELPRSGLKERFGEAFEAFYEFLEQGARVPIQPKDAEEVLAVQRNLPAPVVRHEALSRELEELTTSLASMVRSRGERVRELQALLLTEEKREIQEQLRPAEATTDSTLLHRLLTCRLENIEIPDGVVRIELTAERVSASREQFALFQQHGSRDLPAAGRAFARLRAQLGNDAIQRAVLLNEHVPERQFSWHTLSEPTAPQCHARESETPPRASLFPLIRRIYRRPAPLTAAEAGTLLAHSRAPGNSAHVAGPFYYSGLWWNAHPLERSYYFVHTRGGQIRWLFFDDAAEQWMLTGIVD